MTDFLIIQTTLETFIAIETAFWTRGRIIITEYIWFSMFQKNCTIFSSIKRTPETFKKTETYESWRVRICYNAQYENRTWYFVPVTVVRLQYVISKLFKDNFLKFKNRILSMIDRLTLTIGHLILAPSTKCFDISSSIHIEFAKISIDNIRFY